MIRDYALMAFGWFLVGSPLFAFCSFVFLAFRDRRQSPDTMAKPWGDWPHQEDWERK